MTQVTELLRATLKEEKAAGKKLSEIAITDINIETSEEEIAYYTR